jgi:hypothetical protein
VFQTTRDGAEIRVDLDQGREADLVAQLLTPRVRATTLAALAVNLRHLPTFVAHLAHVYGLVLPLSLGDAAWALGDYDRAEAYFLKARDYRYLNTAIEKPAVWRRLAETYLARGKRLATQDRRDEAREQFALLMPRTTHEGSATARPLYAGAFAAYRAVARAFLDAGDPVAFPALDYGCRIVLLDALSQQDRLESGIGQANDAARFDGARSRRPEQIRHDAQRFVRHETTTRDVLDQRASAANAWLSLEQRRASDAAELRRVAERCGGLATTRLELANHLLDQLEAMAAGAVELAQAHGWIDSDARTEPRRWWGLKRDPERMVPTQQSAARAQTARDAEVARLRAQIETMTAAQAEVDRRLVVANQIEADASRRQQLAQLHLAQARACQQCPDAEMPPPELWGALVRNTLDERDRTVSPERTRPAPGRMPLSLTISLAHHVPYQFFRQFWSSGRLDFETSLADLERHFPGLYGATLRGVEVHIDAPGRARPPRATLTNVGVSRLKERDGTERMVLHEPETIYLPQPVLAAARAGHRAPTPYRSVFDGAPFATGWTLELARDAARVDPRTIADVRLVLDFDARCDPQLASPVDDRAPTPSMDEHIIGLALRSAYPRDFAFLGKTGAVAFTIGPSLISADHDDPRIIDLSVGAALADASLPHPVVGTLSSATGGVSLEFALDPGGTIAIAAPSPLSELRGHRLLDSWTIRFDRARNAEAFAAGFRWSGLGDVFLTVDYAYRPSRRVHSHARV